jgi:hypothetical protein
MARVSGGSSGSMGTSICLILQIDIRGLNIFGGMILIEAAAWGIGGGLASGLVGLSADVAAAGFKWPWRDNEDGAWPRLFVLGVGIVIGGIAAGAAHSQMTAGWPAFLMGVGAPAVIRGLLSRIAVAEGKPEVEADNLETSDAHGT